MPALSAADILSVALRAVSFVLLLQAAGLVVFVGGFGRFLSDLLPDAQRLGSRLAIAGMIVLCVHQSLEPGRMAGEIGGVLDPAMQRMALGSAAGAAFALRLLGLALIAIGLRCRPHLQAEPAPRAPCAVGLRPLALAGVLLVICSFALTGHTSVNAHRLAAAALLIAHLCVIAFWLGSLCVLRGAARVLPVPAAARLIAVFSRVAAWVVPGILLAGLGLCALLVPDLAAFSRPYGQLLLVKVAGFALLMGLAALNKWRWGPRLSSGERAAARSFRRSIAIEYVLICLVIAVTAVMTTLYSPEAA